MPDQPPFANSDARIGLSRAFVLLGLVWIATPATAEDGAVFYRAVNLGGPAVMIDGRPWEADGAPDVAVSDERFENQAVRLIPATDAERARMIRSSRWSGQGRARVALTNVPAGRYSVYVYVWEDNNPETFDVSLGGMVVAERVSSGATGRWQRLGPWPLDVSDGRIELVAVGGAANLSGIEVWRGTLTDKDHPLSGAVPAAPAIPTRENRVAVLLARSCLECHNGSDRKGGLELTRREQALLGGDSGKVFAPGDPAGSLLLERVDAGEMPPKGHTPLTGDERALLREWVAAGAKWAVDPIDPFLYTTNRRAGYNWWSLQPLRGGQPPSVGDAAWPANPIDQFILHRLEQGGLTPSPPADRRTLIRRLSFDLLGLPPAPEEVEAFVNDPDPRAYERLVDRLLDSPHYGERWARHWLDVVRYGESQGFERNKYRESVWKYRDFVVEAFNSDLPYDDFIRWQIAGDVLQPDNPLAVIASGFLALGPYDLTAYTNGTSDMRAFAREEELEGLVATVGQTFLGLTINCARCHDHKFDPITQREFYQISAALGGTYQGDERESRGGERREVEERIAVLRQEIDTFQKLENSADARTRPTLLARRTRSENLVRLLQGGPVHTTRPQQPGPWVILARGDFRQPGAVVTPAGVAAVSGVTADWRLEENAPEAERRKALAEWIADPRNPLTPRVIVNRLWGHHFGQGLVTTASDFGFQGGSPSHPELLDWLARQLVRPDDDGRPWTLKRIQRLILTSAAYRQSARKVERAAEVDAENRLVWRRPAQRLEAETFRDAALAVAGELDLRVGRPGYRDFKVSSAGNNETYTVFVALGGDFNRRSLYRSSVRTGTSPLLDMLDCPDPSVATPKRSVTSTPLQALTLLNNEFMEHAAKKFSERLQRDASDKVAAQVRRAYALAFSRKPADEEVAFGEQFVADHGLAQLCLVLLNSNEFLYID